LCTLPVLATRVETPQILLNSYVYSPVRACVLNMFFSSCLVIVVNAEEVAESGAGLVANPAKYRAAQQASDEENGGGYEDDFHYLTPDEFVDAYRESSYYERALRATETTSSSSVSISGKVCLLGSLRPLFDLLTRFFLKTAWGGAA
jgi:hypothetical protein